MLEVDESDAGAGLLALLALLTRHEVSQMSPEELGVWLLRSGDLKAELMTRS